MINLSELKHLNEGECADIYELDESKVLKISKPGWDKWVLQQEYINGRAIGNSSIPAPRVYDFVEIDGRYGYTMDKLNDVTMLSLMLKKPRNIFKYSREMARIHVKIHSAEVPDELPSMMDEYEKVIAMKTSISEETKAAVLEEIKGLNEECESRICHGDFHPINVLVDGDGCSVIDWILTSKGNPEADVAGTYLISRAYSANVGGKNPFMRLAGAVGGRIFSSVYLREYIKISKMKKENIMRWLPLRAATYIDVGLPEKVNESFIKIIKKSPFYRG